MVPWRTGILLFTLFLVLIPRVSTELKDSVVSVGHDHLRRVSAVQNVSSDVDVEPSVQQSQRELIEAELMKRAGLAGEDLERNDHVEKDQVEKTAKGKNKEPEPKPKFTAPQLHGQRFDNTLQSKEAKAIERGHWEQKISSNPTEAFEMLFIEADEAKKIQAGLLSENNGFIDHVCEYNHKMPKPIVRLKVMVFDAWLMFTYGGTPEAGPGSQAGQATSNNVQDGNDASGGGQNEDADTSKRYSKRTDEKGKFKRDIVRFKEVILHYRPDIDQDLRVDKKDKKKKDVAEKLERMFDLHLKRCWAVARAMNPVARDRMFELDPTLEKEKKQEMPWMRMHEFAYIFILAFGFVGLPKGKDHWQHADWLGLIDWTTKESNVLRSKIPSMATPDNAKPGGDARYKPHIIITGNRREYNFDLLDKWSQQLASDRSSVSGKYVKLVHVSYTAGWNLTNEFTVEDTNGKYTMKMAKVKKVTGEHTKDSGVEKDMRLVKINRQPYSEKLLGEATSGILGPVYTLSFMEKKYRPLYEMDFANDESRFKEFANENPSPRDKGYVQFPIFVDIESKAYQSQEIESQAMDLKEWQLIREGKYCSGRGSDIAPHESGRPMNIARCMEWAKAKKHCEKIITYRSNIALRGRARTIVSNPDDVCSCQKVPDPEDACSCLKTSPEDLCSCLTVQDPQKCTTPPQGGWKNISGSSQYSQVYELQACPDHCETCKPSETPGGHPSCTLCHQGYATTADGTECKAMWLHRKKTKGADDGEQYPDKGFDDPDGLIDFREVDEEAWWWYTDEKEFSGTQGFTWKDIKDKEGCPYPCTHQGTGAQSKWYGPFQKIKLEDFLRHFMSQSLDMFTNLADASTLNHETLDEPLEPKELPPRKEVTLHFDRKIDPGLEVDPWTGKVKSVTSGGQADDFGVEVGWTTLKINGQRVISGRMQKQLAEAMAGPPKGYVETPIKHRNKDGEVEKIESSESVNARAAPYTITFDRGKEKFAPLNDVARQGTAFEIRTANTNALKEYVLKDLRGRTRLNMDAFKFATDRMEEDYARHHLMEHIRAQYSWRSERNENYKRAKMSNTLQQKELKDYKDFLVAVWKAAETMVPFSRMQRQWRKGSPRLNLWRGNFIADPAFHYAAIVAQEFCWRHVREVKGKVRSTTKSGATADEYFDQPFGRDTLMLIPLELPGSKQYSLLSTFELQDQFKALDEFESFSGQDVEDVKIAETGEKVLIRRSHSEDSLVSTVYRIPSQLLKDLPDPWIEHASKQVKKNEKAGYGNNGKVRNWNHVTMNYLDGLFGGNVWADFPISEMSKPAEPPVSHALKGYLDELDSRELARLRENERQKNEHAFDDDPDEVANALKPALGRRDS